MVTTPLDAWANAKSAKGRSVTFVQVGSNDGVSAGGVPGVSDDPIHRHVKENGWRGILIEPVRHVFERLQTAYQGFPDLKFLNVAISSNFEERDIWRVREEALPQLPWFADKISTFHKSILYSELAHIGDVDSILVSERVSCIPLWHVLETHFPRTRIDLLQIDAEGHDLEVLASAKLDKHRPEFVMFEHKHLQTYEIEAARNMLNSIGYSIRFGQNDAYARLIT